jgi:hypothetical protein
MWFPAPGALQAVDSDHALAALTSWHPTGYIATTHLRAICIAGEL